MVTTKRSLQQYAQLVDLKVIYDEAYKPIEYFQQISFREARRCFIAISSAWSKLPILLNGAILIISPLPC